MTFVIRCLMVLSFMTCGGPASAQSPDPADLLLDKAIRAYENRQYDLAYRYAMEASYKPSPRVDTFVLLGELQYLRQELAAAKQTWERALTIDPTRADVRQRLAQLAKELPVEQKLARSDTHPFVVRMAEGDASVDLTELREQLREVYRLVGQHFDTFPNYPIAVIAYSRADFGTTQSAPHQVQGLYDGKIRVPLPTGARAGDALRRVLWHEYAHVLIYDLTKGRCPMWLNEGLATLVETRVHPFPVEAFRKALEAPAAAGTGELAPDVVSWDLLWRESAYQERVMEARYAQGYLIAQYLVRIGGWPQMVRVLKRMGQGASLGEALRVEYHQEPAQLEAEWWNWVRRELGVTARRPRG